MTGQRARRAVGILVLLICGVLLLWGNWPMGTQSRTVLIYPADMRLPQAGDGEAAPVISEQRRLVVVSPAKMRAGDVGEIRLAFEMDGEQPTVTDIPSLYDTYTVIAETRLEITGVRYAPGGEVSQGVLPGQPAAFVWSVRPETAGVRRGTLWLHLRFVPKRGGEEARQVLSAQRIEIQAATFLGLNGATARIVGGVGIVVGAVLGLDGVVIWLWKARRK